MFKTSLKTLWARKRRLIGTAMAVILGVGFLAATQVMGDSLDRSFDATFEQVNRGTDVAVRNSVVMGKDDDKVRGLVDQSIATDLARLPGVASVSAEVTGRAQIVGADGDGIGGHGPPTQAGGWVSDPAINPYEIVAGRAPAKADEVVIDRDAASDGDLRVGSHTTVRAPAPIEVRVVGLVALDDGSSMLGSTYVGFTSRQAEQVLGQPGKTSIIRIHGDGTLGPDALRDEVAKTLPKQTEAVTGAELTREERDAINGDFLDFFKTFLLAFAGVALVVAAFSINNTFTIVLAQRTRESALLRAIGASRRQVLAATGLEALAVGVTASGVGIGAGLALAYGLKALLGQFGMTLPTVAFTAGALVSSFLAGVAITLVAALLPAVRASRVAPIEALRDTAAEPASPSKVRTVLGALASLLGGLAVVTATSAQQPVGQAALGAVGVLAGIVLLGPAIARPVAAAIGAPIAVLRRQPGRLARRNAMRNPRRTASSALALVIGTAVVALFATFGASLTKSLDDTVAKSFGGDLVLTQDSFSGAGLAPEVGKEIAGLPEVAHSVAFANATLQVRGDDSYPTVADPADLASVLDLDVEQGDLATMGAGQIAVSHNYAEHHHLEIGSRLPVTYVDGAAQTLRVGAIYGVDNITGDLLVTAADWAPHAQRAQDVAVLVDLRNGVDLAKGKAAVQRVADRYGAPDVQDRDEFVKSQAAQVDQVLTLVYGLLALAVVIAVMGLANTLALSIHERTRELGLLRALGLTRSQTRSTVRWESVITSVLGTAVGLGLGTFLGWGLVRAIASQQGFVSFQAPTGTLLVVTLLAVAAGIVAAVRPAQRAARLDVLAAITGE